MKNDTTEFASVEAVGGSGRIDLYADIHKALRAWMGHVLTRLGQADAQDHADCSEAVSEMNQLLEVMQMHLETENGIVHPAIGGPSKRGGPGPSRGSWKTTPASGSTRRRKWRVSCIGYFRRSRRPAGRQC